MKDISTLKSDFGKAVAALKKFETDQLRIIGKTAVQDIKQNFKNSSFEGGENWEKREDKTNKAYDRRGNYKGSVYSSRAKLLIQTGNLRDSVRYLVEGKNVFIGVRDSKLADIAAAHNEGLGHQKKRQFMGWTISLQKKVIDEVRRKRVEIMAKFKK